MVPPSESFPRVDHPRSKNWWVCAIFFILGSAFLVLGVVGIILPVMPGVIFFVAAAGCFAKSSTKFHAWLTSLRPYQLMMAKWHDGDAQERRMKQVGLVAVSAASGGIFLLLIFLRVMRH